MDFIIMDLYNMDNKYLKYSLEELLDDQHFIAWILKGENDKEWKSFIESNPNFSIKVKDAEEIFKLIDESGVILEKHDVQRIWQNIDKFNSTMKKKTRSLTFRRTFTVAASILIIVSIGILGYSYLNKQTAIYKFKSSEIFESNQEAQLILGDGKQISLEKDNSTVTVNNSEEIVINNSNTIELSKNQITNSDKVQLNEVVVPYGKRSEILLADGTKVWLNAGSRLAFPTKFTDDTREVYLQGEACFKVAKDKSHPFIVKANDLGIEVLGTHFDVSAYPNEEIIETILIEGSVAVTKKASFGINSKSEILKPFQKAIYSKAEKEITVSDEPNAEIYIAWTEGWFQFSKQSLHEVFTKLERYYNIRIIVPENFPDEERITGKLDLKDSVEDVIKALSDVAKIEYRISGNDVLIDKKLKKNE